MAGRNWLAICGIGGGLLGGALGAATGDIFGGVFGGLLLGGAVGLAVRSKTQPPRAIGPNGQQASVHDHRHDLMGVGAMGLMAHHAHSNPTAPETSCAVDSGGASDFGGGADCGGGGDSGGGGG